MAEEPRSPCLVTGASGFLGTALVERLRAVRTPCRALDRRPGPAGIGVAWVCADVTDPESLHPAFDGVSGVIHAAGLAHQFGSRSKSADFDGVNARGTENVLVAAARAGVRDVVLVSSVSVYGPGGGEARDETAPCRPEGPYAASKLEAEKVARRIAEEAGLRLTILRMATIYGEGDPGNLSRLIRAIDRRRFLWIGDGSNRKSLIHRDDAARACVTALLSPLARESLFNVSAPPCAMREVVDAIAAALGRSVPRLRVPARAAGLAARALEALTSGSAPAASMVSTVRKWLADDVYDGTRFNRAFSFQAEVDLANGLAREVAWYRAMRNLPGRSE